MSHHPNANPMDVECRNANGIQWNCICVCNNVHVRNAKMCCMNYGVWTEAIEGMDRGNTLRSVLQNDDSQLHQHQRWQHNQHPHSKRQQPPTTNQQSRHSLQYQSYYTLDMISERNNVQTHSASTAKQSDFMRRHRTKNVCVGSTIRYNFKKPQRRHLSYNIFLVIAMVLFASLNDIRICEVAAGDSTTGLIRMGDDDDKTNQKYTDLGITSDPLARDDGSAAAARNNPAIYSLDKLGSNLEMSIAAVFNKVAYGTTTKRSISDNVFVPSLTTVPTPQLTTFRYREKEKDLDPKSNSQHHQYQQHISYQKNSNFNNKQYNAFDLDHDHALPTSAPNADILKSNSNPTYPNPNRHHNHGERHRAHLNSTPSPSGHNLLNKGQATIPMYPAELPSYSPPARSYLTPRVPPEYPQNPFAEQPTLRGTNSESGLNSGFNINRRPIPPPSLMPGHEKIPLRPPDLIVNNNNNNNNVGNDAKPKQPKEPEHNHGGGTSSDIERKKVLNTPAQKTNQNRINSNQMLSNTTTDTASKSSGIHFPSISRILSGSNGMNGDIPEILLKTVTARPIELQSEMPAHDNGPEKGHPYRDDLSDKMASENDGDFSHGDDNPDEDGSVEEDFDSTTFTGEEPKMQPKIKQGTTASGQKGTITKKTVITESPLHQSDMVYSTQIIQNLAATNNNNNNNNNNNQNEKKIKQPSIMGGTGKITNERSTLTTWTVAWNIHVYLSAILFTILAVYSIFKMIFYDKLTHLVNQSYFICLHLMLIIICLARIFFLCYDAYNIHYSFHLFISELLLNLPATFLTISFSVLILFLLLRSLNHKNNRYSALMRPLTVFIGSSVHVFLCVTLHYVESYGQQQRNQQIQQQLLRTQDGGAGYRVGNQAYIYNSPPRVLSLICQLIYIFICFSLGFFYLYIYKVLKRVLQKKSQNYIHGYQNLSYAIHITIATALLFILLAALQIYGAISISTTRPIMSSLSDNDWLQWGYQFSLRLIEIAIIALLSWVTGLKTGTTKVLQRDKVMEQHNVSGFALFPCTSSSSQEHFETDYPAICNANTNLHSYTLRTGKPIYDDTFALNSLGMENPVQNVQHHNHMHSNTVGKNTNQYLKNGQDYQTNLNGPPQHPNESGIYDGTLSKQNNRTAPTYGGGANDPRGNHHLNDSGNIPDHYENPNFELHSNNSNNNYRKNAPTSALPMGAVVQMDNCYTEPIGAEMMYNTKQGNGPPQETGPPSSYDFKNFERPNYADRNLMGGPGSSATEFRASKNLKALVKSNSNNYDLQNQQLKQNNLSAGGKGSHHYNPQTHSYNSFDRRGARKSGTRTLNTSRSSQYQHQHDYHTNSNSSMYNSGGQSSSKERHQARSNNFLSSTSAGGASAAGDVINFDTVSYASSDNSVRALNYDRNMEAQHAHDIMANVDMAQNSASSGDSSTSMLVDDHGFVRFRPMDINKDMHTDKSRTKHLDSQQMPLSANSDTISPAITQKHHNRSLT